jgi:ABC-type antimicrobial peptide transport system permease subunit
MVDHVDQNLVFRKIPARMFVVLGPLLLGLAAIGIYAVVAYSVAQRQPEIGMRIALGATARRVVGQLVGETLGVIAIGASAGWLVALLIDWETVQAGALDPGIYAGVPALLLAVATVACWLPARRASRIDPLKALRQE